MTNEQKKSNNSKRNYIIIIALVLCAAAYCSVRGCGSDDGTDLLYKSTDSTVEQIETEHAAAGSELDNVTGQLNSAGASAELMNLLTEARNALSETQQALMNANASLANAEKSLRTATEYTQKLKKQIEAERDAAAEAKERAYWKGWLNGFCCGIVGSVIAIATK